MSPQLREAIKALASAHVVLVTVTVVGGALQREATVMVAFALILETRMMATTRALPSQGVSIGEELGGLPLVKESDDDDDEDGDLQGLHGRRR